MNFAETGGVATMTLASGGNWDPSIVAGEDVLISGSPNNSTQGDQYLVIQSVVGSVVTFFAPGTTLTTETTGLGNITITPVLRDVRVDPGCAWSTPPMCRKISTSTPTGAPADATSSIIIDSAGTINIAGAGNGQLAPVFKAAGAVNVNAGFLAGATIPGFLNFNVSLDLFGKATTPRRSTSRPAAVTTTSSSARQR